jgi:pimeloyl-ACP methyl ester carboxylesterase
VSTYVLVHASWHGAWCWERVTPLLQAAGHAVIAPDLPGHGADPTPPERTTPGDDVARLDAILAAQVEAVILVGHSSGGMLISAAAERRPGAVRGLVYLAAFLLPPGVAPPEVMRTDAESKLTAALVVDQERGTVNVQADALRDVFYGDCSDADIAWAISRVGPEPLRPPMPQPPDTSTHALASEVPRFYIETLRDRALGPAAQRRMYTALPCRKVYSLDTSHSPFLSAPDALAACLLDVDRRVR